MGAGFHGAHGARTSSGHWAPVRSKAGSVIDRRTPTIASQVARSMNRVQRRAAIEYAVRGILGRPERFGRAICAWASGLLDRDVDGADYPMLQRISGRAT
jgi:hypothetical protein